MPDTDTTDLDDPNLDQRKRAVLTQIQDIEAKLDNDADDEFAEDQEAHLAELQDELRSLQGEQKAARGKARAARRSSKSETKSARQELESGTA